MSEFEEQDKVVYVPDHADGIEHRDAEAGVVSSVRGPFVYVRFNDAIERYGWDGAIAKACQPRRLVMIEKASP